MPTGAFLPSLAQRRLRDVIVENPSRLHITEVCRQAGIARRTYYLWCQNPDFCAWLATTWSSALIMDGPFYVNHARAAAPRNFRAFKLMFNLIFDPDGLGQLVHWQRAFAESAQFVGEQNQPLTAEQCTNSRKKFASAATPHRSTPLRSLRTLHRACLPIARHRGSGRCRAPANS